MDNPFDGFGSQRYGGGSGCFSGGYDGPEALAPRYLLTSPLAMCLFVFVSVMCVLIPTVGVTGVGGWILWSFMALFFCCFFCMTVLPALFVGFLYPWGPAGFLTLAAAPGCALLGTGVAGFFFLGDNIAGGVVVLILATGTFCCYIAMVGLLGIGAYQYYQRVRSAVISVLYQNEDLMAKVPSSLHPYLPADPSFA